MRSLLLAFAMGLSFGLFTSAAHAQDTGFFVRGSVGSSDISGSGGGLIDDSDTALGLGLGWRVLPWLAVEAGYNDFGEFMLDRNFCPPGLVCPAVFLPPLNFGLDSVEIGLAARTTLGDSGFFGQARGGLHSADAGPFGTSTELYYGIGVGYTFNQRYSLSLNLDRYEFQRFDVDRIGVGFEIAF